jgi:hypothetical protein
MPGKVNQDPYLKMKKKTKSKGMGDGWGDRVHSVRFWIQSQVLKINATYPKTILILIHNINVTLPALLWLFLR